MDFIDYCYGVAYEEHRIDKSLWDLEDGVSYEPKINEIELEQLIEENKKLKRRINFT